MNIKAILLLLSCVSIGAAKAGHYVFWAATVNKGKYHSMMKIAEELAKRGHEATLVGYQSIITKKVKGITEIVSSINLEKYDKVNFLKLSKTRKGREFLSRLSIDANRNAMKNSQVEDLIRTKHVDVLITYPEMANEASYLLAKKKKRLACHVHKIYASTGLCKLG